MAKKNLGWFTGGGFEKDPFLTEKDKRYYREKLETLKVEKAIKLKKSDWLGDWLHRFSIEGDFWAKPHREKIKKDDWLC